MIYLPRLPVVIPESGEMQEPLKRPQIIVDIARSWIGTPYHHQASRKGVGCDCLGLVRGVYAEFYDIEAERPPAYSKDLAEATGRETLLDAAERHLQPISLSGPYPLGAVLIFRLRAQAMAKHCGILSDFNKMIHAFESGPVCEINLSPWWHRRIAAVFLFPSEPI